MSSRAAIRYAKAVLEQANEAKLGNVVFGDMKSVAATIENSKELRAVLNSPVIKGEDKKKALMAIFEGNSEVTKGVIDILDSNKRINLLGAVAESYVSLYNEAQGVKVAHVTTAVPLSSELETKVLAKVKEMTGSDSVTIENTIDGHMRGQSMP